MRLHDAPETPETRLEALLRSALATAGDGFDTRALVTATHRRAAVQRRRQALATTAATGLAAATLVATWPAVAPGEQLQQALAPAAHAPAEPVPAPTADPTGAAGVRAVLAPPWQDGAPPQTLEEQELGTTGGEAEPSHGAWQIPDPRPTGVAFLEALGDPAAHFTGPTGPVTGLVANGSAHEDGRQALAGRLWAYYRTSPGGGDVIGAPGVEIVVTGWDDAASAMEDLRADRLHYAWPPEGLAVGGWAGHEADPDRLVLGAAEVVVRHLGRPEPEPTGSYRASAVVRTGRYLVAATVTAPSATEAEAVSREVAGKTAENLAVLDPPRGTD